jgi:hypothetical protein
MRGGERAAAAYFEKASLAEPEPKAINEAKTMWSYVIDQLRLRA